MRALSTLWEYFTYPISIRYPVQPLSYRRPRKDQKGAKLSILARQSVMQPRRSVESRDKESNRTSPLHPPHYFAVPSTFYLLVAISTSLQTLQKLELVRAEPKAEEVGKG
ncbi:hypothetical protein GQ43DRAFT_437592 [Delitschia confertaspora ATCC 74209]|uniref:Uncharacterized protein n=1 Tax=Delitschia confertaspora ATCC 74209 TaxID=1513339 RepID=A0A9P4JUU6_9PLEO|nr:hypothetical protein GQ43DRAFT_437592 [Delitschia confertaspora ATCC 74209]